MDPLALALVERGLRCHGQPHLVLCEAQVHDLDTRAKVSLAMLELQAQIPIVAVAVQGKPQTLARQRQITLDTTRPTTSAELLHHSLSTPGKSGLTVVAA